MLCQDDAGVGLSKSLVLLQIPKDAWCLDFVLSDSADGGAFFDSNGGMDYHIDVSGSSTEAQALNVVHIAVEMAPIAKVAS